MARNPFRSESEAYRFLLLTVGYFALIVAAAAIKTWLGFVVFVALTAAAIWFWVRSRSNEPALKPSVLQGGSENERGSAHHPLTGCHSSTIASPSMT